MKPLYMSRDIGTVAPERQRRDRQQRYLERQRNGLIVLPVVCVEIGATQMVLDAGFLASDDPTRQELADALAKWVYQMMTRHEQETWPEL
jgi:hypothetical protein